MNKFLTPGMYAALTRLLADEDQEITWEDGAGWWIGHHQVNSQVCKRLLQLCLIKPAYHDQDTYIVYIPTEEVEKIMSNDDYVPAIIDALRKKPELLKEARIK